MVKVTVGFAKLRVAFGRNLAEEMVVHSTVVVLPDFNQGNVFVKRQQ